MSDKKISELAAATSVGSSDLTVLVQNGTTKSVSVSTLLNNVPSSIGVLSEETVTSNSTLSSAFVSICNSPSDLSLSLPDGQITRQVRNKYIVNIGAGTVTVTVNGSDYSTITIPTNGLVKLVWINLKWWIESEIGATHA